jgi:hypothetical protein
MVEKSIPMDLLGVDVGFSKNRRTTGIAGLHEGPLTLACAATSWDDRRSKLPANFHPHFIAIDGPLLPHGTDELTRRDCEYRFIRAPFHNRCKPALSHFGFGLNLRRATAEAAAQFAKLLPPTNQREHPAFANCRGPIVEAFPNLFLGVLLPEEVFQSAPKFRRGKRFDWLYEQVVRRSDILSAVKSHAPKLPSAFWQSLQSETNHEKRAALICLLTAAFAANSTATKVGDHNGGWLWLPPRNLWQPWAQNATPQKPPAV